MCWYGCALCRKQYQRTWDGTTDVHICDDCTERLRRQEEAYAIDIEMGGLPHDCKIPLEDLQWMNTLDTKRDWPL